MSSGLGLGCRACGLWDTHCAWPTYFCPRCEAFNERAYRREHADPEIGASLDMDGIRAEYAAARMPFAPDPEWAERWTERWTDPPPSPAAAIERFSSVTAKARSDNSERQRIYPDQKSCVVCGVTYKPNPRHRRDQQTCSRDCGYRLRGARSSATQLLARRVAAHG